MKASDLDWASRARDFQLGKHWRVFLCSTVGAVIATYSWHSAYPHVFWFFVLWTGLATGSWAGLLPGVPWQLWNPARHKATSGRMLVGAFLGWGGFTVLSLILLRPMFEVQESELLRVHSLSAASIASIEVSVPGTTPRLVTDPKALVAFTTATVDAYLFYPSHEMTASTFDLVIHFRNGPSASYSGNVPERHPSDGALEIPTGEILVPGLNTWLNNVSTGRRA
jgi:hypothetical protein